MNVVLFACRGKGREFDDLDIVMKKMEHWAHRYRSQMMVRPHGSEYKNRVITWTPCCWQT